MIAVECIGSDTMYHSVLATESPSHPLPSVVDLVTDEARGIKLARRVPLSLATSLGAPMAAPAVVQMACARRVEDRSRLTVVNVPDELAMLACVDYAGKSNLSLRADLLRSSRVKLMDLNLTLDR